MAYTSLYSPSVAVPIEPAVIGPIRVTRTTANVDLPVQIPWKNCKLVYAYAVTTTVVATADFKIDLELDAASGTEMMTMTLATASSAVGDLAEATFTDASACERLDRDAADRDRINIEVNLHATGAAAADVWMFFEPMI